MTEDKKGRYQKSNPIRKLSITLAELFDFQRGKEEVADVHGVLRQMGPVMRDAVEDDPSGVVYNWTHFRLLRGFQQHLFDKKT